MSFWKAEFVITLSIATAENLVILVHLFVVGTTQNWMKTNLIALKFFLISKSKRFMLKSSARYNFSLCFCQNIL